MAPGLSNAYQPPILRVLEGVRLPSFFRTFGDYKFSIFILSIIMSLSRVPDFVAGDENLDLHQVFGFANTFNTVSDTLALPADNFPAVSYLASPFAGPPEDVQSQPVGWLSPSAAEPTDDIDTINFDDFLVLDEDTDDVLDTAEKAPSSLAPELADPSTTDEKPTAAPEQAGGPTTAVQLEAAQAEIAKLKAALAAESPGHQPLATPRGCQSSSSPHKRKSTGSEVSPPKRQITTQVGPIEALWSPKVTEEERRAFRVNLDSPMSPKTSSTHLEFVPQPSAPYLSSPQDLDISTEDLQSIQTFLNDNSTLIHGTSHHVETSTSPFDTTMAQPANMKAKHIPLKHLPRRASKNTATTTSTTSKVTKKPKATPKKTQRQRTVSTTSTTALSPAPLNYHRSIDELLATNFCSLNEQEKCRVLLPMLRNLDPRELEASFAELPCIQAKGSGHETRVARAIYDSPPTPGADDLLASRLTTGTPPSPTLAAKTATTFLPTPALQAPPLSNKVLHVEVNEEHGAIRQREVLEKAALLQAHDKKRRALQH